MKEYRKPVLRMWGSVAKLTQADDLSFEVVDETAARRWRLSWFWVSK